MIVDANAECGGGFVIEVCADEAAKNFGNANHPAAEKLVRLFFLPFFLHADYLLR